MPETTGAVRFRTLGCRLNQAESAEMAEAVRAAGMREAAEGEHAEVVVVNTCTVTAESSRSSRRLIRRAVRENPASAVVVTGCYAVASPEEAHAIEGVAAVLPNKEKDRIADGLRAILDGCSPGGRDGECPQPVPPASPPAALGRAALPGGAAIRVMLKVQTGCDEECSFCIVPSTRGPLDSRPVAAVTQRAASLAAAGAREITLTGVHIGKYGVDHQGASALAALLQTLLSELPPEVHLRLSSIEPTSVGDELLELICGEKRICDHLHLPLQSGDERILRAMGRPYGVDEYLSAVARARQAMPALGLTTDVLVGFPGEDERAVAGTIAVIEEARFSKLHVFRYSERASTPAAAFPGKVAEAEKRDRSRRVRQAGDRLRLEFHKSLLGRPLEVLVEAIGRATPRDPGRPALYGVTSNYVKVEMSGPAGYCGRRVLVEPRSATADGIRGAPLVA